MTDTALNSSLAAYLDAIYASEITEQLPDGRWRCAIPVLDGWIVEDSEEWRARSRAESQMVAWVARHVALGEPLPAFGDLQPVIKEIVEPEVVTQRLRLVPFTATLFAAATYDHAALARLLGAQVHPEWPYPWVMLHDDTSEDALDDETDETDETDDELLWDDDFRYIADMLREPERAPWMWMIIHAQDNTLIGRIGAKFSIGDDGGISLLYSLVPEYHGHGYMTEAARAYVAWAFTHPKLKWIYAMTQVKNVRSRRVLEKLGARVYDDDRGDYDDDDQSSFQRYGWLYWELLPEAFAAAKG